MAKPACLSLPEMVTRTLRSRFSASLSWVMICLRRASALWPALGLALARLAFGSAWKLLTRFSALSADEPPPTKARPSAPISTNPSTATTMISMRPYSAESNASASSRSRP